jgi:hypothetical protein
VSRTLVAFLVAPLWAPLIAWIFVSPPHLTLGTTDIVYVTSWVSFVAYVTTLVFCVPTVLAVGSGWLVGLLAGPVGAIIGWLASLVFWTVFSSLTEHTTERAVFFFAMPQNLGRLYFDYLPVTSGALVAWTFWLISRLYPGKDRD